MIREAITDLSLKMFENFLKSNKNERNDKNKMKD